MKPLLHPWIARALLLLLIPLQPASAGTVALVAEAPSEVAPSEVDVPFSPPLDQVIRYRMVKSQAGKSRNSKSEADISIRFERVPAGGYRMHRSVSALGLPPEAKESEIIRIMETPIIFRVDANGEIVGVEDEAKYWDVVERVFSSLVRENPGAGPDQRDLMSTMYKQMRALPQEQRIDLLAKDVQPLLEFVGITVEPGETAVLQDEFSIPLAALAEHKIPRVIEITVSNVSEKSIDLRVLGKPDPNALAKAVEALAALGPKLAPEISSIDLVQDATYVVSRTTGLTLRYKETIQTSDGPDKAVRITTFDVLNE